MAKGHGTEENRRPRGGHFFFLRMNKRCYATTFCRAPRPAGGMRELWW